MTKVGIIGATGMAGSAIFKEAQKAKLEVTAIVRDADKAKKELSNDIQILKKNAFALTKDDLDKFDVVIDAFSTAPPRAYLHIDLATKLVGIYRQTRHPRFIFILGAGSLHTGNDHHLAVEDIKKIPGSESWVGTPISQLAEFHFLSDVTNVNWVGISPGMQFIAGPPAKKIIYGHNELLSNKKGKSETTSGTMAQVIVKEIQKPVHKQERFTVING